jgi:hypothetical protein
MTQASTSPPFNPQNATGGPPPTPPAPPAPAPASPGAGLVGTVRGLVPELVGLAAVGAAIYIAVSPGHGANDPAFAALAALGGAYLGSKAS